MFSTAGFKIGSKLSSAKFTAIFGATIDGRTWEHGGRRKDKGVESKDDKVCVSSCEILEASSTYKKKKEVE